MDNKIVEQYLSIYKDNVSYGFKNRTIGVILSVDKSDEYGRFIEWDENVMSKIIFENYDVRKFSTFYRTFQEMCYFRDYYVSQMDDPVMSAMIPDMDMKSKHMLDIYSDMALNYYDLYFESPDNLYEYLMTGFDIVDDINHISFNEILISYLLLLFNGFDRTDILHIKRSDVTQIRGTASYVIVLNGVAENVKGVTAALLSRVLTANNMCVYRNDSSIPKIYERDKEYLFLLEQDNHDFFKRKRALNVKYTNSCHKYLNDLRCPHIYDIYIAGVVLKIQNMLDDNNAVDNKHNILVYYNRLNGYPDNYVNNFDTANTIIGMYEIYKKNKKIV